MHFERLNIREFDWNCLDSFEDRTVYQTDAWLDFLRATQPCEPIIAALKEGRQTVGYFTGCIFRKFGLRFLGSPFPGWTTSYMGFNLMPEVSRKEALAALSNFVFRDLRCVHFEFMDRWLLKEEAQELGFLSSVFAGYEIDLTKNEDELFSNMDSDYRRCTRNAEKNGVVVEESNDLAFADDYYAQLRDVFAKQNLVPTYSVERVRSLIKHLHPTGSLLLLRARNPEGHCIATGIFLGLKNSAYFWGGASWRQYQLMRPNHAIQWHAMRYWKARGIKRYDMGGGGRYKANFGGDRIAVPWVRKSKYNVLEQPRQAYKTLYKKAQKMLGVSLRRALS